MAEPTLPKSFTPDVPASFTPDATPEKPLGQRPFSEVRKAMLTPPTGAREVLALPLIAGSGGAAAAVGVPAVAGRIAASGALGAAQSLARGEGLGEMGWHGLLDAIVAGVTEGAVSAIARPGGRLLGKAGAASRAFDWATKAPGEALEAIRARLPAGKWLNVPSLSSAKLTVQEAVDKLATMTGNDYQLARQELASELNRLDVQAVTGPKPLAGKVFKDRTSADRFVPSGFSRVAEAARKALTGPTGRAVADTAAITPYQGIPALALAGAAAPEEFAALAHRLLPFIGH